MLHIIVPKCANGKVILVFAKEARSLSGPCKATVCIGHKFPSHKPGVCKDVNVCNQS